MNGYETFIDDEDLFVEDLDEDLDEGEFLEDFDDDAFESDDEARKRGKRRGRRPPSFRRPRTGSGRGFFKSRPKKVPVTSSTLQASLERVGRDIRTNAVAIKRLAAQAKTATAKLNSVNNRQETSISELNRDLKKNANASQQQNQMNMLLPLLQKSPELEARPGGNATNAASVLTDVQVKKQDNTMALILMMMASQGASGSSSNTMNMMLPMVLLLDK